MTSLVNPLPLTAQDEDRLGAAGIMRDVIDRNGIFRVAHIDGAQLIGRPPRAGDFSGIVFPYFAPDADRAQGFPRAYRLRRDNPEMELQADSSYKEKDKYLSAAGTRGYLYFTSEATPEILADASVTIVLSEGEKKTLAAQELRFHGLSDTALKPRFIAVGVAGVHGWRGKIGSQLNPNGVKVNVKGVIPDLDLIAWQRRDVIILFDANVATNPQVAAARAALAVELKTRGAKVRVVDLPQLQGVNGIDDLIAQEGADYALELIAGAQAIGASGKKSQASNLVDFAADAELFHTAEGESYARVSINGHFEVWALKSKGFRDYLSRRYYETEGSTPSAQGLQDALNVLHGRARFDGAERAVELRVAEHDGALWLDLCDDKWRVVRIDADGWRLAKDAPVMFRRTRGMKPLPTPLVGPGALARWRKLLNISDGDWALLLGWMVAALRPGRPFPILAIHGEQGAAKSTTSKMIRALIDPNVAPLRSQQRDERDLMIAATNSWFIALDNLSSIPRSFSDALCRLSTGNGFATRTLYENDEETLFNAARPVLLNGIEEIAQSSDLIDRAVLLNLPAIAPDKRRTEAAIWTEFDALHPSVLGALLSAVSGALARADTIRLEELPRMADFALWATAAEPGLGLQDGAFLAAYQGNRSDANQTALEASPIGLLVIRLLERDDEFSGTATALLTELEKLATDDEKRLKDFPKKANALRGKLKRAAPNLRTAGIEVYFERTSDKSHARIIRLEHRRKTSSEPSEPSDDDNLPANSPILSDDASDDLLFSDDVFAAIGR